MVANSPCQGAVFSDGTDMGGLTFDAEFHDMVWTIGTSFHSNCTNLGGLTFHAEFHDKVLADRTSVHKEIA